MKKQNIRTEHWMECPKESVDFPGLAYFTPLDQLFVAKKLDELHKSMGKIDVGYTIYNDLGEKVLIAAQNTHFRSFQIKVYNRYGNEVIQISRPFTWLFSTATVWAPPENYVGCIEQQLFNKFIVKNSEGVEVLQIMSQSSYKFVYSVLSHGQEVGVIMDQWKGSNKMGVSFPMDFGVGDKAVMLGACFLIGCLKCC